MASNDTTYSTPEERVAFDDGYQKGLKEIIDWLEYAYINDPGRPDKGTPKADALLELAQSAGREIRKKLK